MRKKLTNDETQPETPFPAGAVLKNVTFLPTESGELLDIIFRYEECKSLPEYRNELIEKAIERSAKDLLGGDLSIIMTTDILKAFGTIVATRVLEIVEEMET